MKYQAKRSGFTLIELLVVIAIIAILAAILFPVFVSTRVLAKRTECLSNIGELGKAVMMYSTDYGGRLPPNCVYPSINWDDTNITTWDKNIFRYVRNKKIFTCPINKMSYETGSPVPYGPGVIVRSYAMPQNVSASSADSLPRPSATVVLYEKGCAPIFTWKDHNGEYFDQTWGLTRDPTHQFWHQGGKNFAFCDGHAQYYKYPAGPFSYEYKGANGRIGYCGPPPGTNIPR